MSDTPETRKRLITIAQDAKKQLVIHKNYATVLSSLNIITDILSNQENNMALGNAERMWTFDEYVQEYEQLQAENERLKETIENAIKTMESEPVQGVGEWEKGMFCGQSIKQSTRMDN